MRTGAKLPALAYLLLAAACSSTPNVHLPDGVCEPPVTADAGQECRSLTTFRCASTAAEQRAWECDLATVVPGGVSGWECDEGIDWRATAFQETHRCSYAADGRLAGAMLQNASGLFVGGYWQFSLNCAEKQLCPPRDAGSCVPALNAYQQCDEDFSRLDVCPRSEPALDAGVCATWWATVTSACDGGTFLSFSAGGLGPWYGCAYSDGGLIGGSKRTDTAPVAFAAGRWQLSDCSVTAHCP